jgi:hypothetical protein
MTQSAVFTCVGCAGITRRRSLQSLELRDPQQYLGRRRRCYDVKGLEDRSPGIYPSCGPNPDPWDSRVWHLKLRHASGDPPAPVSYQQSSGAHELAPRCVACLVLRMRIQ